MKDHRVHRVPTAKHKKLAELLTQPGKTIQGALLEAGYSESVARNGKAAVPRVVWAILKNNKQNKAMLALGDAEPETLRKIVVGRLAFNTLIGKDGGVNSAKALGSDKRINMFTPESQTGVIVISSPNADAVKDKLLSQMDAAQ